LIEIAKGFIGRIINGLAKEIDYELLNGEIKKNSRWTI
jgi:hypothetical protein